MWRVSLYTKRNCWPFKVFFYIIIFYNNYFITLWMLWTLENNGQLGGSFHEVFLSLLLLSRFSHVWLCNSRDSAIPETAAHQALPSLGFSRQEHWSGLPFPSPIHESEKWKWSCSVVSDSSQLHGLQPTRLLRSLDFPSKSTKLAAAAAKSLLSLGLPKNSSSFYICPPGGRCKWNKTLDFA